MPRTPRPRRYRQCPGCKSVFRASEFPRATSLTRAPGQLQRRQCPQCGFIGPLMSFPIVERPAEPDQGAPS